MYENHILKQGCIWFVLPEISNTTKGSQTNIDIWFPKKEIFAL